MTLEEADHIHQSVVMYPGFGWNFGHMALKAFNAHQHFKESLKSDVISAYPVPTLERLDGATAELRLLWRMLPPVYRDSRSLVKR